MLARALSYGAAALVLALGGAYALYAFAIFSVVLLFYAPRIANWLDGVRAIRFQRKPRR